MYFFPADSKTTSRYVVLDGKNSQDSNVDCESTRADILLWIIDSNATVIEPSVESRTRSKALLQESIIMERVGRRVTGKAGQNIRRMEKFILGYHG